MKTLTQQFEEILSIKITDRENGGEVDTKLKKIRLLLQAVRERDRYILGETETPSDAPLEWMTDTAKGRHNKQQEIKQRQEETL